MYFFWLHRKVFVLDENIILIEILITSKKKFSFWPKNCLTKIARSKMSISGLVENRKQFSSQNSQNVQNIFHDFSEHASC